MNAKQKRRYEQKQNAINSVSQKKMLDGHMEKEKRQA
jgi:hypothetical protein